MQTITAKLPATVTDIQTQLQPLLALYDAAKANPITGTFIANHTGLDEVLDMVRVEISNGTISVKSKSTGDDIISGPSSDAGKWTPNMGVLPVPQIHPVISPVSATVEVGKSVNFSVDVMRSANKKVTWSVVETDGGTITDAGVYTAPAIDGTYHVKAVSAANTNWPVTATVKVLPKSVDIAINPTSATVAANGSQTFTATVTGPSNTKVTWSVQEQNGGSITSSGLYTAPATAGTYHVKAVSAADPSKSATATVAVIVTGSIDNGSNTNTSGPFPIGTWKGPHGALFTVSKLFQKTPGLNYYAGTITFPAFGTVNVSGNIAGLDTSAIVLGSSFGVTANTISGTSATFFNFISNQADNVNIPTLTQITGDLIVTSSVPGNTYNEKATFTKQ